MHGIAFGDESSMPESAVVRGTAIARLIAGLLQVAALYFLHASIQDKTWPATDGQAFAPLLLIPVLFR